MGVHDSAHCGGPLYKSVQGQIWVHLKYQHPGPAGYLKIKKKKNNLKTTKHKIKIKSSGLDPAPPGFWYLNKMEPELLPEQICIGGPTMGRVVNSHLYIFL